MVSGGSPSHKDYFGRYRLGPELGAGGMATVTFAVATGALGFARPVAIKRIHPGFTDEAGFRQALRAEARIASRIRHPNVVAVLDVIEDGDDVGIVLEYVHGESLSSLLRAASERGHETPLGVATAILADVLHGLHAAHTAVDDGGAPLHVVHRDVSPQNVIVGADGVARVLDFGISKAANRATTTRDGNVKGKMRYMSPEQVGGEVSPATDVYAAGLVLWEALAGRSPFDDVDHAGQLVARVLSGVSIPPSSSRSDVPPALDAIVVRALARLPSERFATAAAMAEALEATGIVAPRSAVASFVDEHVKEVLAARASVVALLERGMPVGERPELRPESDKTSGAPVVHVDDTSRRKWSKSSSIAVASLLGLCTGAAALATRSALRQPRPADVALVRGTASPSPLAPGADATSGPQDPALSVLSVTRPTSSERPAPLASVAPAGPARLQGKPRKTSPSTGTASAPDCSVPFTVDANGDRHYRRECFE
jgi:serine/threonine protein kinase